MNEFDTTDGEMSISLTESAFEWNVEDGVYYVTLVTLSPVEISGSNAEELITVQG